MNTCLCVCASVSLCLAGVEVTEGKKVGKYILSLVKVFPHISVQHGLFGGDSWLTRDEY